MTGKEATEGTSLSAATSLGVAIGEREPKIHQIVIIALVTAVFALVWFASLSILNTAVWKNDFITANRCQSDAVGVQDRRFVGSKFHRGFEALKGQSRLFPGD